MNSRQFYKLYSNLTNAVIDTGTDPHLEKLNKISTVHVPATHAQKSLKKKWELSVRNAVDIERYTH
jgi:hypothetical protein